ncbi:class I SAM-dependent methyltransferase [Lentilitoribacter sp. EG35]|uniref:class I SAM-dependent methyltransferase n=1 Tax=Lentilitoribacter sp. EG35 TaxID=3234192 RepID=UPI0034615999
MSNTSDLEQEAASSESIATLTADDIKAMSYNDLIGLVRETNRFPGGRRSIQKIASRLMLSQDTRLLEVGCATGSTAIELNRLVGCVPTAIDINQLSINESKRRAEEVNAKVKFMLADATKLPFEDKAFELVICGNVTALIEDKLAALAEYKRVLSDGGYLVAAPLYYTKEPSDSLIEKVRTAIQVPIPILYRDDALNAFQNIGLEIYDHLDFEFEDIPSELVHSFCKNILSREHLKALSMEAKTMLDQVYLEYMLLFRENMTILGYTIIFLRKTDFIEDADLFTSHEVAR